MGDEWLIVELGEWQMWIQTQIVCSVSKQISTLGHVWRPFQESVMDKPYNPGSVMGGWIFSLVNKIEDTVSYSVEPAALLILMPLENCLYYIIL